MPGQSVLDKILSKVPKDQAYLVMESMRTATPIKLNMILAMSGAEGCGLEDDPKTHKVTVRVKADMQKIEHFRPDSPFWNEIAFILKDDPYVASYVIKCNDILVRDSDTFNPDGQNSILGQLKEEMQKVETGKGPDMGNFLKGLGDVQDIAPAKKENVPVVAIKDSRFDYDRDFLPKDVGTDVKILLESCNSIDEFLKLI